MKTENSTARRPVVMVIGGHDPSGGAGLQADIESVAANGCHAVSVMTALTVQDSSGIAAFEPMRPDLVLAQADRVMEDFSVAAIKTGMIASTAIAEELAGWLDRHGGVPLVIDPVLAGNRGDSLAAEDLAPAFRANLLPGATIATPNTVELARLAQRAVTPEAAATELVNLGCRYVLVTGGHEDSPSVTNRLYGENGLIDERAWPRLPREYHGSGCTLAAAIAARLALGETCEQAVENAQRYTYQSLTRGEPLGKGQWIPRRW